MAFYRKHPIAFGLLVGLIGTPILIFAAVRFPSFGAFIFGNPVRTRFVVFTATIFILVITHFRPRHKSGAFWIVMTGIFALHTIFFVSLLHYFRQLTSLDYIIYGPIEALIIAIVFPRAMHLFHTGQIKKPSTVS